MSNLQKKLIRDLRQHKGQFIAITVVIMVGAFFFTGFSNFARNLGDYADNYFSTSNLADLWLYYSDIAPQDVELLAGIDGVEAVEGRISFQAGVNISNLKTTLKVQTLSDTINQVTVLQGEVPIGYGEISVDQDYALAHGIQIGDTLSIVYDGAPHAFVITGFCESAEYTIKSRDSSDYPPNHKEYGIAYLSHESADKMLGLTAYNEIMLSSDGSVPLEQIESSVERIAEQNGHSYLYILHREANLSYKQFTDEVEQQKEFAKILPIVFFAVAAVITYLTMSRMVDIQRGQIGVMKAMGAAQRKIALHYAGFALTVGLAGGLIGALTGSYLFPLIFMEQVTDIITLPGFSIAIHFSYVVQALFISVVFGVLACILSVRKILKENAAQAMRIKPPKAVTGIAIERFSRVWGRFSYNDKLILRNIFINKRRALFSTVGIVFCVAFLILAFGYKGSRAALIEKQYTEVYNYDLRVVFDRTASVEMLSGLEGVEYSSGTAQTEVVVTSLSDKRNINLIALSSGDQCIRNYTQMGELLELVDDSVIISQRYADMNGLAVGDALTLKLIDPGYQGRSFDVVIGGISVQYLNQDIFCTFEFLQHNAVTLNANTLLFQTDGEDSTQRLHNMFSSMDTVTEVKTLDDQRAVTEGGLENLYAMVIVIIICATVLAAAAIYNISVININERVRELATLKVLGSQRKRINKLVFKENIIITALAIIFGIPIGIVAYVNVLAAFTLDSMVFPVYITTDSILWPVAITLMVTLLCNGVLQHKTNQIDMIESLKSNE